MSGEGGPAQWGVSGGVSVGEGPLGGGVTTAGAGVWPSGGSPLHDDNDDDNDTCP